MKTRRAEATAAVWLPCPQQCGELVRYRIGFTLLSRPRREPQIIEHVVKTPSHDCRGKR